MKSQVSNELKSNIEIFIDTSYNYTKNNSGYKNTFLEFGATNCRACKQMETVLSEIRAKYPNSVKVVFINITKAENQDLMKYFGISVIPTQVLLNKEGKEYFRHCGFFSSKELEKYFTTNTY
jgi:thioredoxin 1